MQDMSFWKGVKISYKIAIRDGEPVITSKTVTTYNRLTGFWKYISKCIMWSAVVLNLAIGFTASLMLLVTLFIK